MNDLQTKLEEICKKHGVASLYAFGSRAEEISSVLRSANPAVDRRSSSDLDIAVQPASELLVSPRIRVALAQALEGLFGVSRVDLVILPEASAFLAADAVRGELLFADDLDRQAREELYYLRRAADLLPMQKQRLQALLDGEIRT
jgi:predicted nucleotidyltransferase